MKTRVLLLLVVLAFLLSATPGSDHKLIWCHYPPGAWTGTPGAASHVLLLNIDESAIGGVLGATGPFTKFLTAHLGHSPVLNGFASCDENSFSEATGTATGCAEGVASDPDNAITTCPGAGCTPDGLTGNPTQALVNGGPGTVTLVAPPGGTGPCVCPVGTTDAGSVPAGANSSTANCGTAG